MEKRVSRLKGSREGRMMTLWGSGESDGHHIGRTKEKADEKGRGERWGEINP